ncbi:hypothetical protein GJR96_13490 [Haloferax sp. MBLA0076]|uniref:Uncharacterized protein n=1 Tax=Haloferax litoreum TaxID=2666140 RepID=A0A6A8GKI4_9EURY|nr:MULTISPECIES: hypothetical protein [Haloferax]KAB1194397.1 hypothetical protein Hfx1148_13425 [Haloferax sp. CBA1148]MRX22962.1 hypothetical protein [Haloferax litoreum]
MSDIATRFARGAVRLATAPETLAVFVVLVLAWGAGFVGVLPKEVWIVDFPALAAAFFLDTLAFNEFGVGENTVFYSALVVFGYVQAMLVATGVRVLRRRLGHPSVGE